MNKRLGQNPLTPDPSKTSVFSKTIDSNHVGQDTSETKDSRIKNQESRFLNRDQSSLKGCNVRLPEELIDWLAELVKNSSRDRSRSRIRKEVWVQAALEYFQSLSFDWNSITDESDLRRVLEQLRRLE
jgi:hypothetical protein